jgi:hypothetical protein
MDWVGNARHGVVLPYNYFNALQWQAAFERAGLDVERWNSEMGLYAPPLNALFGRRLHFVAQLAKRSPARVRENAEERVIRNPAGNAE